MNRKTRIWGTVAIFATGGLLTVLLGVYLLTSAPIRLPAYGLFIVLGAVLVLIAYPLGAWLANREHDKQEMFEDWRRRNRPPKR